MHLLRGLTLQIWMEFSIRWASQVDCVVECRNNVVVAYRRRAARKRDGRDREGESKYRYAWFQIIESLCWHCEPIWFDKSQLHIINLPVRLHPFKFAILALCGCCSENMVSLHRYLFNIIGPNWLFNFDEAMNVAVRQIESQHWAHQNISTNRLSFSSIFITLLAHRAFAGTIHGPNRWKYPCAVGIKFK